MELTKQESLKAKGVAIIGMIMLHLFCRLGELPYTPLLWIGETPLMYYLGLFGDFCVPIYCFCSGYAHFLLKDKEGTAYTKRIPKKIIKFLCNYWIILVFFSFVGFLVGDSNIPGSLRDFLGNMFLYKLSYNGAWWFVITYILLLLLSPLFSYVVRRIPSFFVVLISGVAYFIAYVLRFNYIYEFNNPVLDWIWVQFILLGTSQFGYVIGMIFCKDKIICKVRNLLTIYPNVRLIFVLILPLFALIGHSIIQSLFVAPFTAIIVLISLFVAKIPCVVERCLLFLGKHSGNIWFIHMFFYLVIFEGLVFIAKYPLLIVLFMFAICIPCSIIIDMVYTSLKSYIRILR